MNMYVHIIQCRGWTTFDFRYQPEISWPCMCTSCYQQTTQKSEENTIYIKGQKQEKFQQESNKFNNYINVSLTSIKYLYNLIKFNYI